jgi:hypothetical protein
MSKAQKASEQITEKVTSWPGVTAATGLRGEFAFKLGGREIGHLHGDHAAHFAFPKNVGVHLREQGGSSTTRYSPAKRAGRAHDHKPGRGRHRRRDPTAPAQTTTA